MKEEKIITITLEGAKEELNKLGLPVKTKSHLFRKKNERYLLKDAIDFALRGPRCLRNNINISEEEYPELVYMYMLYRNATCRDGSCKRLNMRFFDKEDKYRYTMQEVTDRLKLKGWNFESSHKRNYSEMKAAKKAKLKAQILS